MSTRKYNYKGKDVYLQKELKELKKYHQNNISYIYKKPK
jgi:hypothetical protein